MSRLTRRDAIKVLTATGVPLSFGGCSRRAKEAALATNPIIHSAPLGYVWPTVDPFLFCVHHDDHYPAGNEQMGPAASLAGRYLGRDFEGKDGWRMYHGAAVPGFPRHPHRGFETVTVVRRGLLDHSDSMGATARYGGGDVQWLTAGVGIQHAEMFPLLEAARANPVELFQIWLNLPRADKLDTPHFSMFWAHRVPRHVALDEEGRSTEVTVVAGRVANERPPSPPPSSWAARADSDVAIWTIRMAPNARWTLPAARRGTQRTIYFFRGRALRAGSGAVSPMHSAELQCDLPILLQAGSDETELLLLQGRPIGEPIVKQGPFVMSSPAEIQQTIAEYHRTGFGGWPWQSNEPVHSRGDGRFALYADGHIERPS